MVITLFPTSVSVASIYLVTQTENLDITEVLLDLTILWITKAS
jgi:hypothetical protein